MQASAGAFVISRVLALKHRSQSCQTLDAGRSSLAAVRKPTVAQPVPMRETSSIFERVSAYRGARTFVRLVALVSGLDISLIVVVKHAAFGEALLAIDLLGKPVTLIPLPALRR